MGGKPVDGRQSLDAVLAKTKPGQKVQLTVARDGKELTLSAKLRRRPLDVIQPEDGDPLSMLLTLQQYDGEKISDADKKEQEEWDAQDKERKKGTDEEEASLRDSRYFGPLARELKGVNLRTANWKVIPTGRKDVAQFRRSTAREGAGDHQNLSPGAGARGIAERRQFPGLSPGVRDRDSQHRAARPHKVAYRLGWPERLADRREMVCLQGEPQLGRRGPSRLHRFIWRKDAGDDRSLRLSAPARTLSSGPTRLPRRC